jgi:hypothetical protein
LQAIEQLRLRRVDGIGQVKIAAGVELFVARRDQFAIGRATLVELST